MATANKKDKFPEIDRDIFRKEDSRTEDLHLQLSEKYMLYKDLADRCIINPTETTTTGDNRVFYIRPDTIFTQEPRIQNAYRNEFVRQVSAPPAAEPFTLMADDFHKHMLADVSDQSQPIAVREKLFNFYKRRQFLLQHKRHKYLQRWSHFAMTSDAVDRASLHFQPSYSKIQFELEQAVKRHQRLEGYDHFDNKPRPQRIEPNGLLNADDLNVEDLQKHSSLRADDFDVYNRIVCYEAKCQRLSDKYINRAKWAALHHRYEVFSQAQERVQQLRVAALDKQRRWQDRIDEKGTYLIELKKLGERGQRELAQIKNSLPFVKQDKKIHGNKKAELLATASYNHELPPTMIWNQVELKLILRDLCDEFKIEGDMEIDDGNSFSYSVVTHFPTTFFSQMIRTQFAPYDAVPQILNPAELGRTDIMEVIAQNQKKYGKGAPGSTLLEQLEIQKQSEQMKIQYINQIEKALFGEFNNGQLADFPKVRLKKATWLSYVCFKPEIGQEQMQQAALLSGEHNPKDQVAAHVLEIVNVNDITNVQLTLESLSKLHAEKLRSGRIRNEFLNFDLGDTDSIFNEQQKEFLVQFSACLKTKKEKGLKSAQGIQDEELGKNSLYETQQHLLFAEYLMVCLKTREHKTKLLYVLNAFRSIQKRLALDLREFGTRDRISFDVNIVEPKESSQSGLNAGDDVPEIPANAHVESVQQDEMIDINRYKYNDQLQNRMWSTCPILPKYHITFGEPIERQECSMEYEMTKNRCPTNSQAPKMKGRVDFIKVHEQTGTVLVTDDFNINVMYDCTFGDMRALEQELLITMSHYINKIEPLTATDLRNIFPAVDRFQMAKEIIICEERYQRAKLDLAFQYLECYEHVCDTLEQQRLIQVIVDIMGKRPKLNLNANHFLDSYEVEIQSVEKQAKLMKEFVKMQVSCEKQANQNLRESIEKSYRLIYEQMEGKFQTCESVEVADEVAKQRLKKYGVNSDQDAATAQRLETARPGMWLAKNSNVSVQIFSEMLGLPIQSLQFLLKEHHERDPLVKQTISENTSFTKLHEGYPVFYTTTENKHESTVQVTPNAISCHILELFESLGQGVKVASTMYHSIRELFECHQPDNGLIASMYELVMVEFLLAEMYAVQAEDRGDLLVSSNDNQLIEDTTVLGNSEKMYFYVKELAASQEDSTLGRHPNVWTKFNQETLLAYDFEKAQESQSFKKKSPKEVEAALIKEKAREEAAQKQAEDEKERQKKNPKSKDEQDLDTVEALEKMLDNPDDSCSDNGDMEKQDLGKLRFTGDQKQNRFGKFKRSVFKPSIPSMMILMCNSLEVMRLRSLLLEACQQRDVLMKIYSAQCQKMGKEPKISFKDSFNFDTHMSGGENWTNFVDQGPGHETTVPLELSIKEFDPTMLTVINFGDPEAFKAMIAPLGVEEMRIVTRYELMNLQCLILGVRHNQFLIENCQRSLAEIDLFEKGFMVSARAHDIVSQLTRANLYEANLKRLPDQERRKIQLRLTDKVAKCAFSVIARKNRPKDQVERCFKQIRQNVMEKNFEKIELGLRYMRLSRMMLAHDYCTDVESSLFLDAIRMELINETSHIRRRAYLLPREAMIHKIPLPNFGEHNFASYSEEPFADPNPIKKDAWEFYNTEHKQISDFWKIPDNFECCTMDLMLEDFQRENFKRPLYKYNFDMDNWLYTNPNYRAKPTGNPENLPELYKTPHLELMKQFHPRMDTKSLEETENSVKENARFVDYKQAPKVDHCLVFKYLFYFRQLSNLFDLEFFRNKLSANARSIATLEQSVMSGLNFWETKEQSEESENGSSEEEEDAKPAKGQHQAPIPYSRQPDLLEFKNKLADLVVQKIQREKKEKIQLTTELDSLKVQFTKWAQRMRSLQLETDFKGAAHYLHNQVQISYFSTFLAVMSVRQWQIDNCQGQKEVQTINDLVSLFSHLDDTKVTYTNGYHVNLATTSMKRVSLDESVHRTDYSQFFLAAQPVIDEQGLNPPEFNLVNGMYTTNAVQVKQYRRMRPYLGWMPPRDFHYLDCQLLNMSKELRKNIGATAIQTLEDSVNFAHAKLNIDERAYLSNNRHQLEVFAEQQLFIKTQLKSRKLAQVLIILMTKRLLPSDIKELAAVYNEFSDMFNWKVHSKIDEMHKTKQAQQRPSKEAVNQIQEAEKKAKENQKLQVLAKFDVHQCEVDIYQREIQSFMIITAMRKIENESTALAKAFETNGKRLEVLIDVRQQFAATFDSTEDKRNHLDIVNKVAPVQKMLTAIKNRMLVIKTLTGGEGIIIRTKDMNSILEDLCRSIIKNGEIEMRTRCEQLCLQIIQYENLLYAKDQQLFNMEHKLKSAKDELNKIVSTKVFSKGNQIIYELDHTARQLRLIKDNIFQLEGNLKETIKLQFEKDLEQARLMLVENRKKVSEYQKTLNSHMEAAVERNKAECNAEITTLVQRKKEPVDHDKIKTKAELFNEYSHLLKGDAKKEYKEAVASGQPDKNRIYQNKDLENIFKEMERLKATEKEAREDLLEMQNLIRKQRMMQNFKWVIQQRKWDAKIENLRQQLTSNTTLWEQLAESEKRERVLKNELQRTQEEVASQDKVLERLRDELKFEQLEKHKLMNFKETKMKRLNQLEDMAKQMELLQSIDLDKVLGSMGNKEKQLEQLRSETKDGAEVIAQIYRSKNKEVQRTREFARQESAVKDAALNKMEALRAEIQLLQSGDLTSMNLWKDKVQKLKDQKSEILSQLSSTQFDQQKVAHLMNQTSGSISLPQTNSGVQNIKDHHASHVHYSNQNTPQRKTVQGVKVLPQLSSRGLHKKKVPHRNIFDQLVQDSQLINVGSHKEPQSTRKLANRNDDSLLQASYNSYSSAHHDSKTIQHQTSGYKHEIVAVTNEALSGSVGTPYSKNVYQENRQDTQRNHSVPDSETQM